MNKKLLTLGVASAVFAAMPVAGVFAAADTTEITDTVKVTVSETCTLGIEVSEGATPTTTLAAGEKDENMTGSAFSINCNKDGGWDLKAKGATESTPTDLVDGSGNSIKTGTTFSGDTSAWAMKVTVDGSSTAQNSFDSFHAVPEEDTIIAKSLNKTDEASVQVTYGAYISGTQKAGTYTGKVTYTLTNPAASVPGS